MGKTFLAAMGLLFIVLLALGMLWVAGSRQLATTTAMCMSDPQFRTRIDSARTPADITRALADVVNCIDRNKTFLAGLFFNHDDEMKKLEQQYRQLADVQEKQFKDFDKYQRDMEKAQSDREAQRNLQEFRRGVYQGSGKQP